MMGDGWQGEGAMGQRIRVSRALWAACLLAGFAVPALAAEAEQASAPMQFAFLIGVLCLVISGLYASNFLLKRLIAALQHRRACRIPAVLQAGGLEFSGLVTVIGLTGCRFQPLNKALESRLLALMNGPVFHDFDIRLGNRSLPVFLDGYHSFFTAAYFYHPLEPGDMLDLLKQSQIAPYPVSRIGHHSTRRKYRRDIERRISELAVIRQAAQRAVLASAPALP